MKVIQVMSRHNDYITHLEFSHDGNLLVSTSADKSAIIWELRDESFNFSQVFRWFRIRPE